MDIRLGGAGSGGAWGVGRANLNRRKRDEADEKTILACTHSTNLFFLNVILLLNALVCREYRKQLLSFVAE